MYKVKIESISGFLDFPEYFDDIFDAMEWVETNCFPTKWTVELDGKTANSNRIAYNGEPAAKIIFG